MQGHEHPNFTRPDCPVCIAQHAVWTAQRLETEACEALCKARRARRPWAEQTARQAEFVRAIEVTTIARAILTRATLRAEAVA